MEKDTMGILPWLDQDKDEEYKKWMESREGNTAETITYYCCYGVFSLTFHYPKSHMSYEECMAYVESMLMMMLGPKVFSTIKWTFG